MYIRRYPFAIKKGKCIWFVSYISLCLLPPCHQPKKMQGWHKFCMYVQFFCLLHFYQIKTNPAKLWWLLMDMKGSCMLCRCYVYKNIVQPLPINRKWSRCKSFTLLCTTNDNEMMKKMESQLWKYWRMLHATWIWLVSIQIQLNSNWTWIEFKSN